MHILIILLLDIMFKSSLKFDYIYLYFSIYLLIQFLKINFLKLVFRGKIYLSLF